jgi:hypothetical protein
MLVDFHAKYVLHLSKLHIKHRLKITFAPDPTFWGNILQQAQIDILGTLT